MNVIPNREAALAASIKLGFPCRLIVIDDGYSQCNSAWPELDGDVFVIREMKILSRGKRGLLTSIFGGASGIFSSGQDVYTVGDQIFDYEETRGEEHSQTPLNRFLVHAALKAAGVLPGEKVIVATGLPLEHIGPRRMDAKKDNMLTPVEWGISKEPGAEIVFHGTYGEAIGGLVDHLFFLDEEGNFESREKVGLSRPVLVLDIGGSSTDIAVLGPDLNILYKKTEFIGVKDISNSLRSLLENKLGMAVDSIIMDEALNNKSVDIGGDTIDCVEIWEAAVEAQLRPILALVEKIKKEVPSIGAVVGIGGGVALCENVLKNLYPSMVIPENPDGANARGFLLSMIKAVEAIAPLVKASFTSVIEEDSDEVEDPKEVLES